MLTSACKRDKTRLFHNLALDRAEIHGPSFVVCIWIGREVTFIFETERRREVTLSCWASDSEVTGGPSDPVKHEETRRLLGLPS
jgi:hypothetical protein